MTLALLWVVLSQAPEVFIDRGESFVRMGTAHGLQKGTTLDISSAQDGKSVGTAVVMEVWDGLARVSLDTQATAYKGLRLAKPRMPAPAVALPQPAVAPPPPPPPAGSGGAVPVNPPQVAPQRALHARVRKAAESAAH